LIATIRHRSADERLYLGVVGEFSSGKSTFINALLREQFLDSRATEGTTVLPTFIEYRPPNLWERFCQSLGANDRRVIEIYSENSIPIRRSIDVNYRETCNAALARAYGESLPDTISIATAIRVGIPSTSISDGLVIIDTPGINSCEPAHLEAARRTISQWADAVAVLTPANQPLPMSLCAFIRENLGESLHRCILIATHLDVLRPAEREQQLDFIRRKFLQEFNLEPVAVLGAAPLLVVLSSSKSLEDKQELATFGRRGEGLVQQFKETEQNLRVVLKKGRDRLIQERIRSLLQLLLSSLGKNLSSLKESNIGALNNSKSQRPQDLADFTKCQQEKYMQHFSREIHKVLDQILSFWTHQIKDIQDEIKQGIQTAPNLVVLGTFARENPTKMRLMKLSSALHNLFSEILRASTNLCERLFESYRSDLIITYPEIQVKDHPQRMQILKLQVTQECITKEIMRAFNSLGVFGRGIGTSFLTNWFTGHTLVSKRSEAYRIGSECVVAIRVHWEKDLKLYTIQLGQQLGSELERLSIFYQRSISREVIRIQAKHGAIENLLEDNLARLQTDLAWIEHQTAPGKLPPPLTN
jgi:GTPase SAR1 family protein